MKAITLHQPWATLIALGHKTIETRSWPTSYRGQVAIHAGKQIDVEAFDDFEDLLSTGGFRNAKELPAGAVVAVATLSDCVRMTKHWYEPASVMEHELGYFAPGRYAWHLADVEPLQVPVPTRGYQGLWDWEPPQRFYALRGEQP